MRLFAGFCSGQTLYDRVIQGYCHSRQSHCFLAVDDGYGLRVLQSTWQRGTTETAWNDSQLGDTVDALFELSTGDKATGLAFARQCVGCKYDRGLIVKIALAGVLTRWKLPVPTWLRPAVEKNEFCCSEFLADVLQVMSYPSARKLVVADSTPADVYTIISACERNLCQKKVRDRTIAA